MVSRRDALFYLPEFGVRSEIDVFLSEDGPVVTTAMQTEPVLVPV